MVFIVPYRDREKEQIIFSTKMKTILEDIEHYEIKYIHQQDHRTFNRGAMKNIGFLYVKNKYPKDYKNITLVFNDVDTFPSSKNILNYETVLGTVKHFYGFKHTLGGIVSVKCEDFEKVNGFPNYWSWGYEDNAFQKRLLNAGLNIDRSNFFPRMDKNIIDLNNDITRIVNRNEVNRYVNEYKYNKINDGIDKIKQLKYNENTENDFVNVTDFITNVNDSPETNIIHDLRNGTVPFNIRERQATMRMHFF